MTYIDRFHSNAGGHHTKDKLAQARRQVEYSFKEEEKQQIPQVKDLLDKIDAAMAAAVEVSRIFAGSGTHTLADFMPGEDGVSENDRQMAERDRQRNMWP